MVEYVKFLTHVGCVLICGYVDGVDVLNVESGKESGIRK